MEGLLKRLTKAPLVFLPNSVDRQEPEGDRSRTLDFLWVNRITPRRRASWMVYGLKQNDLKVRSGCLLGLEQRDNLPPLLRREQEQLRAAADGQVELLGFRDPTQYYRRAKFFCLPSEFVFGNNSLLEAMSWGVVPIVTHSPGIELIVADGVSGIVTALDRDAYVEGMRRAASLDDNEWKRLSSAARETVRTSFSLSSWAAKMVDVYRKLGAA